MWIFVMLSVLALICIFVCQDIITAATVNTLTAEEKKAELQEQLAQELREYYISGDNWQKCNRLIQKIEKLDDSD